MAAPSYATSPAARMTQLLSGQTEGLALVADAGRRTGATGESVRTQTSRMP